MTIQNYLEVKKMNDNKYNIIWTIIWMVFIVILIALTKNYNFLWLLILWILGIEG